MGAVMRQVVIRDLDERVVEALQHDADRHGRSVEDEAREILTTAALVRPRRERFTPEERLAFADAIRARARSPQQTESLDLLREDRAR